MHFIILAQTKNKRISYMTSYLD